MTYSFRLKFKLSKSTLINIDAAEWCIDEDDSTHCVKLKSLEISKNESKLDSETKYAAIKDSKVLVLTGKGYLSGEEASKIGNYFKDNLILALVNLGIGADLYIPANMGGITNYYKQELENKYGCQILNEEPGVMVYKTDPQPLMCSASGSMCLRKSPEKTLAVLSQVFKQKVVLNDEIRLAYDLYSSSFFQESPETRFLLLMMAIETLIILEPRADKVKKHINKLILETKESDLPQSEKESILGSLDWLYFESIGQAGRKLMEKLKDKKYYLYDKKKEKSPKIFFTTCYGLRSALVHGQNPKPCRNLINGYAAVLETMVKDLILCLITEKCE
jgi:hypothetical protein